MIYSVLIKPEESGLTQNQFEAKPGGEGFT